MDANPLRSASLALVAVLLVLASCNGAGNNSPPPANDTVPPTVTATVPANGATGVSLTLGSATVTFSEPVDCTTVTSASVAIAVESSGTVLPGSVDCSGSTATFTLALPAGATLAASTSYVVKVTTAVKDLSLNPFASEFHARFTTTGPPAPLAVVRTDPPSDATQVPLGQIIELYFSAAPDCTTVKTDPTTDPAGPTYYVNWDPTVIVPGAVVCVGTLIRLVPAQPLLPNTRYTVGVSARISGAAGQSFPGHAWQFTTGNGTLYGSLDVSPDPGLATPPAIVNTFRPNFPPTVHLDRACGLPSSGGQGLCTEVVWTEALAGPGGYEKNVYVMFEPATGEVSRADYLYHPDLGASWGWWRLPSVVPITAVVVDRVAGHVTLTDLVMSPSLYPAGVDTPPVHATGTLLYTPP